MSKAKTATGKAAPKSGAAEARAEKGSEDEPRKIDFRGLELNLPETLPATMAFDMEAVQSGNLDVTSVIRLIRSMVGNEQLTVVRNKIATDGDSIEQLDEVLTELMEATFAAYGMTTGESSASETS